MFTGQKRHPVHLRHYLSFSILVQETGWYDLPTLTWIDLLTSCFVTTPVRAQGNMLPLEG